MATALQRLICNELCRRAVSQQCGYARLLIARHCTPSQPYLCRKHSELFGDNVDGSDEGTTGDKTGEGFAAGLQKPESGTETEWDSASYPNARDHLAKLGVDDSSLLSNFDSNADFSSESGRLQVDISFKTCKARDAILRRFLQGVYWTRRKEFELLQSLLSRPYIPQWAPFAEKYPFVFDYEWKYSVPQTGVQFYSDLLFTDGFHRFLAVEIKDLQPSALKVRSNHGAARTRRRSKVRSQGKRSAMLWHHQNQQVLSTEVVVVTGGAVDDDVIHVECTGMLSRE